MLWSQARRFRYGFSMVGAREAVCCWSCQPSLFRLGGISH
ncbi:unnamed protein product [Brassica oleracea var. botrytis]